ncbi:MAG: peptidoglycan-binding protein [Firmicutes bacterium]|nr:peptidoglycan-binding protein [Bacillota bacterium]
MKKILTSLLALALVTTMLLGMAVSADALSYSGSASYKSGKYYTALTKVKLTGNNRTDIVNVAKSQVGYQEGSSSSQLSGTVKGNGNYTEYGRWYGTQDMWCHMFVSWCAARANIASSVVPKTSFTVTGLTQFKNQGRAYSRANVAAGKYTPQAGDIVYFKSSRNNNICNHVGIVTKYSGKTLYTIEGNTSSATISTNGGMVANKSYSISNTYIVYICKPNYTAKSTTTVSSSSKTSSSSSTAKKTTASVSYPTLQKGASGYKVKALQFMLNNYNSSKITVDGTFGAATFNAVKAFQKSKGLSQDGIVGAGTWGKLCATTQSTSSYKANLTKAIQTLLNGKIKAGLSVDGVYGAGTKAAVIKFQKSKGLTQDGVVGATTWKYLLA